MTLDGSPSRHHRRVWPRQKAAVFGDEAFQEADDTLAALERLVT
jgi:hypothetical protein